MWKKGDSVSEIILIELLLHARVSDPNLYHNLKDIEFVLDQFSGAFKWIPLAWVSQAGFLCAASYFQLELGCRLIISNGCDEIKINFFENRINFFIQTHYLQSKSPNHAFLTAVWTLAVVGTWGPTHACTMMRLMKTTSGDNCKERIVWKNYCF